jgi:hypothetical protein
MKAARALLLAFVIITSAFAPAVAAQSNDVTWEGEVSLEGNPAVDGATYQYDIADASAVDNFAVDITGERTESWSNSSVSGVGGGATLGVSAAGTSDPIGPAGGDPQVSLSASKAESKSPIDSASLLDPGESKSDTISAPSGTIDQVGVYVWGSTGDTTVELSIDGATAGTADVDDSQGSYWAWIDTSTTTYSGGESVTITVENTGSNTFDYTYAEGYNEDDISVGMRGVPSGDLSVSADDGTSHTFTSVSSGDSRTAALPVSTDASSVTLDSSAAGSYDLGVDLKQVVETQDPAVEVNGNVADYSGTLADGETASLSVDSSWIQEGTNRVNISVASPSGAPSGSVGLDYGHTAADSMSVAYEGETWSERYNVSRTYSGDRQNTSLSIPFSSDRVVAVRDAEFRTNGGSWSSIPEADRQFDGSTLVLDVGDVAAGDSVAVRANGSKVRVNNGEITVLQPTTEGDKLDSEIQLDSWGDNSNIDVSETLPDNLHYVENASWSSPNAYVDIDSGGTQKLYLPSASSGSTARIATMPMAVSTTGDVEVSVETAGKEPTFDVRPGETTGDSVEWNYQHPDIVTGQEWIAYSVSNDRLLDSDTAESPILLETTDSQQTIEIREDDSSGSTTEGDAEDEIIGPVVQQGTSTLNSVPAVLFVWALIVAGMALLNEMYLKTGGSVSVPYIDRRVPTPGGWLTWVVSIGSGIFILEYFSSGDPISGGIGAIFGALGSGLSEVTAFAGIVAVVIGAWYAYRRWIRGQTTNIQVVGRNE